MKEFAKLFAVCSALFMAGCASGPNVASAARAELVSTGQLRVGLIFSNQVLVTKNLQTGELKGVAVALGKTLAKQIGVPFQPILYANPASLVKSFGGNEWDIAFLAVDPARAQAVDFSPPYMVVDNTYLVPRGSILQKTDGADQPGIRIAVPERSAPDLFLSRSLKTATIIRVPGGAEAALEVLRSGRADAYAENAHMLSLYSEQLPGSRLLDGRYTVIQHAIATPRGHVTATQYVRQFIEKAKTDGTIRDAIAGARLQRVAAAP